MFLFIFVKGGLTSALLHWPIPSAIALACCTALSLLIFIVGAIVVCVSPRIKDEWSLQCPTFVTIVRYIACFNVTASRHERKQSLQQLAQGNTDAGCSAPCCACCCGPTGEQELSLADLLYAVLEQTLQEEYV